MKIRNILEATNGRKPFFGCFGLHEWAMLYSGKPKEVNELSTASTTRHQDQLQLRVSQATIDGVVNSSPLRCTHYDAWRFFQKDAQAFNVHTPMRRNSQVDFEQPGCVHASMDLFRYAYEVYPLVSSEVLVSALLLAVHARQIDMRASPYDVAGFQGCEDPICVETAEGRRQYVLEQEALAGEAQPVRAALLDCYNALLRLHDAA